MTTTTGAHVKPDIGFDRGDVDPDHQFTNKEAHRHVSALNNELRKRLKKQLNVTWHPQTGNATQPYDNPVELNHPDTKDPGDIAGEVWADYVDGELDGLEV